MQLDTTHYPACRNQPGASDMVTVSNASAIACAKASRVRAACARKQALILDQHASIGEQSGAEGGRERRRAPAAASASATPTTVCACRLSSITPGPQVGEEDVVEQGETSRAIGEAFDGHCRHAALQASRRHHGALDPAIDRLGRMGTLTPGGPGIGPGHSVVAAGCIETEHIFRGHRREAREEVGALLVDIGALVLGGATRFFPGIGRAWSRHGSWWRNAP
jgi:hypothetical protein